MIHNHYDQPEFFEKYSQMSRSKNGLSGAGEWHILEQLLPNFAGKTVLDMGCGYGWHARYAAEHGAEKVLGVDCSRLMLEVAREKNGHPAVEYRLGSFEETALPEESFDVMIASLMLHYLPDYGEFVEKAHRWLKPGGILIYNVEHPVFTAAGSQNWYFGEDGKPLHFPVDRYYIEGQRQSVFLGETIAKYHRTLTTYLDGLLAGGFRLLRVVEPAPSEQAVREIPGMADELRRPMMLIVKAEKL